MHATASGAEVSVHRAGHDVVEKPPFFMHHTDTRKVVHCSYYGAQVRPQHVPSTV